MECCGRQSYLDYSYKGYYPTSCCKNPQDCRYETVFKTGCKEAFVHYWDVNADIIKYAGLGVAAIEVSSSIFLLHKYEDLIVISSISVCWICFCLLLSKQYPQL